MGNKIDLTDRVVTLSEGKELADALGVQFIETSVKENKDIVKAFDLLLDGMLENVEEENGTEKQPEPEPEEKEEVEDKEESAEEILPEEKPTEEKTNPNEPSGEVTKLPTLGSECTHRVHAHKCIC